MNKQIRHLKDDIYQLLEIRQDPYEEKVVITQGSLSDLEAYIKLEERGLL